MKQVIECRDWNKLRKEKNMRVHFERIDVAVAHFQRWPCITSISNIRLCLDDAERDIKNGDAAIERGESA